MKHTGATQDGASAAQRISKRIAELGDWRGEALGKIRAWIKEADPEIVETWKWMGTPVWEHDGIVCTGESYQKVVKMTFAKGASLPDPAGLFNSSLEGNTRRAIDVHEGEKLDERALKALIRAAVALNTAGKTKAAPAKAAAKRAAPAKGAEKTASTKAAAKRAAPAQAAEKTASTKAAGKKASTKKAAPAKHAAR